MNVGNIGNVNYMLHWMLEEAKQKLCELDAKAQGSSCQFPKP